jgi:hypothetical protein
VSLPRLAAALALGSILAALPFLRYADLSLLGAAPHSDHEARHGGQVAMVGDHHLELVQSGGEVAVYLSDAWRRPLRPRGVSVAFDGAEPLALRWERQRMAGAGRPDARAARVVVELDDGTMLAVEFDLS